MNEKKNESLIYLDIDQHIQESEAWKKLHERLKKDIPDEYDQTIYVFQKPMLVSADKDYYNFGIFLIIQDTSILVINCGENEKNLELFYDYCDDIIDDINSLVSEKYPQYYKLLGRKRNWSNLFKSYNYDEIEKISFFDITTKSESRKIQILSSLIIGSINAFDNFDNSILNKEKLTVLEAIKNKITLFDRDQTKFIYKELDNKKTVRLQGLAGSGKTELLLHKIRKKFVDDSEARIAVTCYNKVLADSLYSRIIDFFNTMKVTEQISTKRLFIGQSWGSKEYPNSGLYSKICSEYGINFRRYSYGIDTSEIWKEAINYLETHKYAPIFDYLFIDEGQDFDDEYIKLCEMVTAKKVYIAGDILQNIFSKNSMINAGETDYVLNKVYRTDPRTILFSHVLGFGLLEDMAVRWLTDSEWELSGYDVSIEANPHQYRLKRKFIERFEGSKDLKIKSSVEIINVDEHTAEGIVSIIRKLRQDYSDLSPKDLAIIFTHYSEKTTKDFAINLGRKIRREFGWDNVLVPREKRVQIDDEVTITNINNVKGLEFSFVIIIDNQGLSPITTDNATIEIRNRNALYMALTRSFVTSYLVVSNNNISSDYIMNLKEITVKLKTDGANLTITKPKSIIEEKLLYGLDSKLIRTQEDIIYECIKETDIDSKLKPDVYDIVLKNPEIRRGITDKTVIKQKVESAIAFLKG